MFVYLLCRMALKRQGRLVDPEGEKYGIFFESMDYWDSFHLGGFSNNRQISNAPVPRHPNLNLLAHHAWDIVSQRVSEIYQRMTVLNEPRPSRRSRHGLPGC